MQAGILGYPAPQMVTPRGKTRELRIIAGTWRGRRLRFPAGPDIRPTPDRVRETLFNWLAPYIRGARVLDLFAGSGALGLEALSRGAAQVTFVDTDPRAVAALRERLVEWDAASDCAELRRMDALRFVEARRPAEQPPFNVVFLDPPFAAGLWQSIAARLEEGKWLAPGAFIYLETPARERLAGLPAAWRPWREGNAGEVGYHLLRKPDE
jgi:16S rRNA (guanine966-N2)-methyltransferase